MLIVGTMKQQDTVGIMLLNVLLNVSRELGKKRNKMASDVFFFPKDLNLLKIKQ